MYSGKKILGLIPARGGSKGLPGKNIRPLLGKPLAAWTIEQARASRYLDKIIVSTDAEEIAAVARRYGAEVPFMRPPELSTDHAKAIDVILHAIEHFSVRGERYDLVMLLQPTSPLRAAQDIDNAVERLFSKEAQSVVSVCEAEHHPYGMNILPPDGSLEDFLKPEAINSNRQELPVFYRINGAIYMAYIAYLQAQKSFVGKDAFAYIMPREKSVDIDSIIDLKFAECLLAAKVSKQ